MSLRKITLLGILGILLQVVPYTLSYLLKIGIPNLVYFHIFGTVFTLIFFIGFFIKQKNSISVLNKVTILAVIGQCLLLGSYIFEKISYTCISEFSKQADLGSFDLINKASRMFKISDVLFIIAFMLITVFFIVVCLKHRENDLFKKLLLSISITGCVSIFSKLFNFIVINLLPYDILDETLKKTHDKISNISTQIDIYVYLMLLVLLLWFFIVLYKRQSKIKEI